MEDMIPCSVKDQEVFQRVWQRVMAGQDNIRCPIEAWPPEMQGDLSCECLEALARPDAAGTPPECAHQNQQPADEAPTPE